MSLMLSGQYPDVARFENQFSGQGCSCFKQTNSLRPDEKVKESYEYKSSALLFATTFGAQETMEFISSLIETRNDDILRTSIIQSYTTFMWKQAYGYMLVQGLAHVLFVVLLTLQVLYDIDSLIYLIMLITYHCVFVVWEVPEIYLLH
jgi:hypothetical protein